METTEELTGAMWWFGTKRRGENPPSAQATASWADRHTAPAAKPKAPRRRASRREILSVLGFELLTLALGLLIVWGLYEAYHGQPPEWLTDALFNFGPLALIAVAIGVLWLVARRVGRRRDRLNKTGRVTSASRS